jgi:hypothetical protein
MASQRILCRSLHMVHKKQVRYLPLALCTPEQTVHLLLEHHIISTSRDEYLSISTSSRGSAATAKQEKEGRIVVWEWRVDRGVLFWLSRKQALYFERGQTQVILRVIRHVEARVTSIAPFFLLQRPPLIDLARTTHHEIRQLKLKT